MPVDANLFRGAREHDHGPAVDACMGQPCNAVNSRRARHREQHPRNSSQEATCCCCIPCCLLIAEAYEPYPHCLKATFSHFRAIKAQRPSTLIALARDNTT